MSKWVKILNIILAVSIISAAGFLFYKNRVQTPKEKININSGQNKNENKTEEEEVVIPKLDGETKLKIELQKTASIFAERYGSYSNQSDYENITDLKPFMTKAMQSWADNFLASIKKQQSSQKDYFGVSSKVLNSEIEIFTAQQVIIKVNCQKRESTGSSSEDKIYYQEAKITFLKEGGTWKVAQIKWE